MGTNRRVLINLPDWMNITPGSDEPGVYFAARDPHAAACVDLYASLIADVAPELAIKVRAYANEMRQWRRSRQG